MRRLSGRGAERPKKMSSTVTTFGGECRKVYIRTEVGLHAFQHTP